VTPRFGSRRRIRLPLSADERDLLKRLPLEVLALLENDADNAALKRLFPPAYAAEDDTEFEAEYRRLMGDDLRDRHRTALETLVATADAKELNDEQAQAWLIALNELRLVLGTTLDVQEEEDEPEPDDPRASGWALYQYLSYLQSTLLDELSRG
jgi:hypothetical protein